MHFEFEHPLIKDKLTRMRNKETNSTTFRSILQELTTLLAYEATKDMKLIDKEIDTPITHMVGKK